MFLQKYTISTRKIAGQDFTEKPKLKFNSRDDLREKAVYPSINTKKNEDVPEEFKPREREGKSASS